MSMAGCVRFHTAHCAHESACESLAAIPSPLHITRADGVAMELSDIDLNLLVLFQQLMVERRVSKVADNLGLTQPAVSNALAKLRRIFGDELFLRTSGGMVPTPFAEQLGESVGYALGMIHSGLNQRTQFTPATLKRTITIGMTDIGEIVFLPALLERLGREAPGVTLNTVRNNATHLREDMEAGKVDLEPVNQWLRSMVFELFGGDGPAGGGLP